MGIAVTVWFVLLGTAFVMLCLLSASSLLWRKRKTVAEVTLALLLAGVPFLCVSELTLPVHCLLIALQSWLVVVAARLISGRLPDEFLRTSTRLNVLVAIGILAVVCGLELLLNLPDAQNMYELLGIAVLTISLLLGWSFVYQALWTLKHYTIHGTGSAQELPTVSLAIPARNETHALTQCLTVAVASDYPKLEVLVLDDCSQDNTPELIRAFAHSGVRFVQGDEPAEGWLGKTQALSTLAKHSSGQYILFAGVDTQLAPQSISRLVAYALSHDAEMVSVLPQDRGGLRPGTLLWQLRYYWQIVLPVTRRRVPVATQCWLIRADALERLGGFDSVKHKIVAEGSFARRLFAENKYRFIVSNPELGITTAKRLGSQQESAIRFLYPTFKRQPLYVLVGCVLFCLCILLPFALAVVLALQGNFGITWMLSVAACVLLLVSYLLVGIRTLPRMWLLALLVFPLALLQDLFLLSISMLLYEFGEVNWKGRNVCYPVLSVYSRLPK